MSRRIRLAVLLGLSAVLAVASPAGAVASNAPTLKPATVQTGLVNPWDIAFAPRGQMLVTERPGRVRVYRSGASRARLLATTTLGGVRAEGEAGVMGIALHPHFNRYRSAFICVSRQVGGSWLNQLIRYRVDRGWKLHFGRVLVDGMAANTNHNGCAVEIGPDRKIWMTMGDAGNPDRAQDPNSLNGKVLRLNLDGSVPKGNPILPGASGRSFAYSMGHRNPQGITFHPGNGRPYVVEHGPTVNDEINRVRPGRNYGWPCVTGFGTPFQACSGSGSYTDPVWASGGSTIANSGGAFLDGPSWGAFDNQLVTAQLKESDLRRYKLSNKGNTATRRATYFNNRWGRLRAVVRGPGDKLWITTSNGSGDRVVRITPIL